MPPAVRSLVSLASLSVALTLALAACGDPAAPPTPAAAPNAGFSLPYFPCVDSIFKADFTADAAWLPPGPPVIGSWTMNTSAGSVYVVPSSGWMWTKPVQLHQTAGLPGGVGLHGRISCVFPPTSGHAVVYWRSLVHSATVQFGAVVLRDYSARILAALEYRPGGVLTYDGVAVPGAAWTQDMPQLWRIDVDLTGHTTTLALNNVYKLGPLPYYEAAAANLWQIGMELGGTSAQTFAWDDIQIVRAP